MTTSPFASRSFAERIGAPVHVDMPGEHLGLRWRTVAGSDLPHLVTLFASSSDTPLGPIVASQSTVGNWYREVTAGGCSSMIGGWDGQGQLQALGVVRVNDRVVSELQADVSAIVSTQWSGRGIGRALLDWQDVTARHLMAVQPTDMPVSIRASVGETNTERRRLLAAGGFTPVRHITHMIRRLDDDAARMGAQARSELAAKGMSLVPITSSETSELMKLHNRLVLSMDRYQPLSEAAWAAKLGRADEKFSTLLTMGDSLVGYTLAEHIASSSLLHVYFYGLESPLRHRGIGTLMLCGMLPTAYESGIASVSAPAIGAAPSLQALQARGFTPESHDIIYSIDL